MESNSKVFWSNASLIDLDNILEYLKSRWTIREIEKFKVKLFKRIDLINRTPKLFKVSKQNLIYVNPFYRNKPPFSILLMKRVTVFI